MNIEGNKEQRKGKGNETDRNKWIKWDRKEKKKKWKEKWEIERRKGRNVVGKGKDKWI